MAKSPDEIITAYQAASEQYHQARDYRNYNIYDICKLDDPRVPELIVDALRDNDEYIRHAAYTGLISRRDYVSKTQWDIECTRYLPILLRSLNNGSVRGLGQFGINDIGLAIARVGGMNAINSLIDAMGSDYVAVRVSAQMGVRMLRLEDAAALPFIIQALKHEHILIRCGATNVLCEVHERFKRLVFNQLVEGLQFPEFRIQFTRWLGEIGDAKAAPALISLLADDSRAYPYSDYSVRTKHVAQEALRQIGDGAIPALREALKHDHEEIRAMAVYTLGRINTPKAVSIVRSLTKHPDTVLRDTAKRVMSGNVPDKWVERAYPISHNLYLG